MNTKYFLLFLMFSSITIFSSDRFEKTLKQHRMIDSTNTHIAWMVNMHKRQRTKQVANNKMYRFLNFLEHRKKNGSLPLRSNLLLTEDFLSHHVPDQEKDVFIDAWFYDQAMQKLYDDSAPARLFGASSIARVTTSSVNSHASLE